MKKTSLKISFLSGEEILNFPPSLEGEGRGEVEKGDRFLGFLWAFPDDLNCQKVLASPLATHSLIFCRQLQLGGLPCCSW